MIDTNKQLIMCLYNQYNTMKVITVITVMSYLAQSVSNP
jgi:hypothetical protein